MGKYLLSEQTRGVFAIAVTPFSDTGTIDDRSVDSMLDFYVETRVHGITILGVMGEAQKLTCDEALSLTRHVLRHVGARLPVVVGVSGPALSVMKGLTKAAMDDGAAGVMIAPGAGLRTDDQTYSYYAKVFETIGPDVPVVYQDYPQTTGVYLSASLFHRLVRDFPQLVMLKHEDCPGLAKITQIRTEAERQGLRRTSILIGNGALYYPLELRRGADGAMTGFAYPEMLVEVFERFTDGDAEGAEDVFDAYLPILRYEQQPGMGLAIRKEILFRRRAIASPALRPPGYVLSADDRAELDCLMARLERQLSASAVSR
ncbi:MAG: dihydrodipicolinate synthase family protein [Acidobacteria bacterium]|nr:dihydrodipicolinate synthase family protein [Acidobacteriota bacterium]